MAQGQAHLKRWITGLSALLVLIVCVVTGGALLSVLVGLACLVCLWEYFRIVCPPGTRLIAEPILLAGYAGGAALIVCGHADRLDLIPVVLTLNVIACGLISLFCFPSKREVVELVAKQIQGLCYISLPLSLLILLRMAPDGMTWVFLLCAVIFAGDTAALYAGTLWGRHKLSPSISPGKTVEGALAGLAANLAVGAAAKALFLSEPGWIACLLFAVAAGGMGQIGDLFESRAQTGVERQGLRRDSAGPRRDPRPHRCAALCGPGGLRFPFDYNPVVKRV